MRAPHDVNERREDEEEYPSEEDKYQPAATDEEAARTARRAAEDEEKAEQERERRHSQDERPWAPPATEGEPDTETEASAADVTEQSKPWALHPATRRLLGKKGIGSVWVASRGSRMLLAPPGPASFPVGRESPVGSRRRPVKNRPLG